MSTPVWLHQLGRTLKANSPSILAGVAAAGVVGTAILAVRATPKALEALSEARVGKYETEFKKANEEGREYRATEETLSVQETVQAAWRLYLPAAMCGGATIACLFGSSSISNRRNAAMLGAYTLAETAFSKYKDKVVEQLGAPKEHKVTDSIAADRIAQNPVTTSTVIITGSGDQLCHDSVSGRYFRSDIEKIRRAENEFNAQILADTMWGSLNDFYTLLGLEHVAVGEILGWNTLHLLHIRFSSHLTDDGTPCLALDYEKIPFADYSKF